jgi:hypothetical protein
MYTSHGMKFVELDGLTSSQSIARICTASSNS